MNDLLDLPALEEYLGTAPSCTQGQLDTAVAIVRSHCNWHLGPSRTETFTIDDDTTAGTYARGRTIWIPTQHLTEVVAVTIGDVELDAIRFKANGTIRRNAGFGTTADVVDVEATHGHPLDDLADVVGIIAQLALRISPAVTPTTAGTVAPVEETIAGYSYKLPTHATGGVSLSIVEQIILDAHRLTNTP